MTKHFQHAAQRFRCVHAIFRYFGANCSCFFRCLFRPILVCFACMFQSTWREWKCRSEQDLPRTKFTKGLNEGHLMAKDHSGILLLIAACLRTTIGRRMLRRHAHFKVEFHIADWAMFVETLLQWEMWLKSDSLEHSDVQRSRIKHQFIVCLMKKVGK